MRTWAPQLLLTGYWRVYTFWFVWDHHDLVLIGTGIDKSTRMIHKDLIHWQSSSLQDKTPCEKSAEQLRSLTCHKQNHARGMEIRWLLRIIMTILRAAKCDTHATLFLTENRVLIPLNPMLYDGYLSCLLSSYPCEIGHKWWDIVISDTPNCCGGSWWWCGWSPFLQLQKSKG